MNSVEQRFGHRAAREVRLPRASGDLAAAALLLAALTAATSSLWSLPASYAQWVFAAFGVLSCLLLWYSRGARPDEEGSGSVVRRLREGLGPANRVTLARAVLVLPVAGFIPHAGAIGTGESWWILLLATAALVLDGVDGRIARRTGTSTAFGARFDMELDAFLMLSLSLLVALGGKVGWWILLIGALRYLFVLASLALPALRADLPASFRRKTVCVVQGAALLVCLAPVIPSSLASALAAGALALLVYSFAVDVRWLLQPESIRVGTAA